MNIYFKRPLFTSCFLFVMSSVVSYFISPAVKSVVVLLIGVSIFFTLILCILKKFDTYRSICFILSSTLIAAAILSSYFYFDVKAKSFEKYYDKDHTIEATVISTKSQSTTWSVYEIEVSKIDGETNKHKSILTCQYGTVLEPGYSFSANLYAESPEDSTSSYNEKSSLYSNGIFIKYVSTEESEIFITDENAKNPKLFFANINGSISNIFTQNLDKETSAMCSALFLGNRDALDDTVIRDFTRAGAAHILALSGMHMSIIMGALALLLHMVLGLNHKVSAVILSICALSYLFITGCSVSAARSVIMLLMVYLSTILFLSPDPITYLGISATALIMISPGTVLDAGYWMSIAATLGILVFMPAYNEFLNKILNKIKTFKPFLSPILKVFGAFVAGVCALIPLMIVMCVFIKQISLFSLITSTVLAIPSEIFILFSLLFIVLFKIPFISTGIENVLSIISDFMTEYCASISDLENVVISIDYPFTTVAAFVIGAALLCAFVFKFKKPLVSLIPFAVSVLLFAGAIAIYSSLDKDRVAISYVNVSQTTDMLVMTNNGDSVIFDNGTGSLSAYQSALSEVRAQRSTEIKAIVLTKYNYKHNSTLFKIIKSNKVRELWIPHPLNKSEFEKIPNIKAIAEKYGVEVHMYENGETLTSFDSVHINIFRDTIERSVVPISFINITTQNESFLYCSSAFNEINEETFLKPLQDSEYIVFGNAGPVIKKEFSIPQEHDADILVFADKTVAANFKYDISHIATYALSNEKCKFYLNK